MARIRPATYVPLPKLRLQGAGRINGAGTQHQGMGFVPFRGVSILGNGSVHLAIGNVTGTGSIATRRLLITQGTAIARRRSVGTGIVRADNILIAGTGIRIDAESAVVQLFNLQGNPSGFGPSAAPEGVFFGVTDLANGDVFWFHSVPAGCTATPLAGGDYLLAVGGGVAVGSYLLGWTLRKAATGVRTTGNVPFSVT